MRKIGNVGNKIGFFLLFWGLCTFLPGSTAFAQSPSVKASVSQSTVYTGDRISLAIEISGQDFNKVSRPKIPEIKGFRLVSSAPSTSRSYSFVNGRTRLSFTYTYQLAAERSGSFSIPPIPVEIDGKIHHSAPIELKVKKRSNRDTDDQPSSDNRPIFIKMKVSEKTPVYGEQIIADVVLYFKNNIEVSSFQPIPGWKAEGFWKEQLDKDQPNTEPVLIDGVRYRKATLLQYALFPTRSGKLNISPFSVAFAIRKRSSKRDPMSSFFGSFGGRRKKVELETDPLTIDVQPLPGTDDANFIGAVGSFSISRTVNETNTFVGETIELSTHIEGTGNIPLISKPEYDYPGGLEQYDPKESSKTNRHDKKITGEKTYTDVLIARQAGVYTIPSTKLAYYHPPTGEYKVKFLPEITIHVEPDPESESALAQNNELNITPITGSVQWTRPSRTILIHHWWFWALLGLPLITLGVGYWQKKYYDRIRTDRQFARYERAMEVAEDRLQAALNENSQKNIKRAYTYLHQALTGFIGDRLGLAEAGLSDEEYLEALDEQGLSTEIRNRIKHLLQKSATIQFAPQTGRSDLEHDIEQIRSLLTTLEKEL